MNYVVTVAMATAVAWSGRAGAQQRLSESEFLAPLGRDHSASVQALGEEVARAEADRLRAGSLANPRLSYSREHPSGNPVQTTWSLSWAPPLDGRVGLAKSASSAGLEAATLRLAAQRLRLRGELRKVFADWAIACERRTALAGQRAALDALAVRAERRAELGEESGMSARRLRLASSEAAGALASAIAVEAGAEARARALRPDLAPGARPEAPPLARVPDVEGATEPHEVAALRSEVRQAELEHRLAGRFVTFPELEVGWQRLDQDGRAFHGPVFGAVLSVPLFDRSQAARLRASRQREIAAARLSLAQAKASAELSAALTSYRTLAGAAVEAAAAARGADKVLEAATAAFHAGESSLTDLLDVTRAVLAARVTEWDLLGAALEAHRSLEIAAGRPLGEGDPR